ncbi:MAG: hypothetical protein MdMp014T_2217 [Treponematales bacterium]
MMKMTNTRGVVLLLFLLAFPAFAEPDALEPFVGAENAARLRAGETLVQTRFKDSSFTLLPAHETVRKRAEEARGAVNPTVMAETLTLYRKPAPGAGAWTEAERTALFNAAVAISTLAGIEYYSASRGAMRVFYETSTVIDGPGSKTALPDPVFDSPPLEFTLYARQKDLTFGDNLYRYVYYSVEDALVFVQENLSAVTYGVIPAVGKNKLRSMAAVIDAGDFLVLYAVSMAKAASLPGLTRRIGNSFTNRALAVLKWYAGRADEALGNVEDNLRAIDTE